MSIEGISSLLVGLEAIAAIVIIWLDIREVRFLRGLQPLLGQDEDLPLYAALVDRAIYVSAVGFYLLILAVIGITGLVLGAVFPPIRPINGLLFLGLLAGPIYLGRAMRRQPKVRKAIES